MVLLVASCVEERYAAIVQVVAHAHRLAFRTQLPEAACGGVALYVLYYEDGVAVGMCEDFAEGAVGVAGVAHPYETPCFPAVCRAAAGVLCHLCGVASVVYVLAQEGAGGAEAHECGCLAEVGEAQIEFAHLALVPLHPWVLAAHSGVGVVGVVLAHDIADEPVGRGRLHSEASAVWHSCNPDCDACDDADGFHVLQSYAFLLEKRNFAA